METYILAELLKIEQKENVRILHAVESGSRAWGFASHDSDYDVRFIYVREAHDYLRLDKMRDVIEWKQDEILDINGWDLQKTLRLLHNSNPTLFEWSNSPIVYRTTDYWTAIKLEINGFFLQKAGLHHYLSTAKSNYREYLKGETVKLKKYFYVVRPLLACKWIIDKKSPPPMLFIDLVEAELDSNMRPIIDELLQQKTTSPEMGEGRRIDALNAYIDDMLVQLKETIDALPPDKKSDWTRLNQLFIGAITQAKLRQR